MPDDFEQFWRSHELSRTLAAAPLNFLREVPDYSFDQLESFRAEVKRAHRQHCIPDNRPPRPSLRLVRGD